MEKNRNFILLYLNGERREISGPQVFMTLSDYLRNECQLTGTKVVCAEGDCGACTVLVGAVNPKSKVSSVQYQSINACIQFIHGLDCCQVITIEGLPETKNDKQILHPVQNAMIQAQATQCGFCTPGFVMAAAGMMEIQSNVNKQQAKNHLTGNLCRCTGYQSIINAMLDINHENHTTLKFRYHLTEVHHDLLSHSKIPVQIEHQTNSYYAPLNSVTAAQSLVSDDHKIFAASTDLGVQYNKGHWQHQKVISLNLIDELHDCYVGEKHTRIGARITLSQLEQRLKQVQPEWVEFMHIFASPQIKNNGTLIGNIANGSPIGDNLPFLLALDASLTVQAPDSVRTVNINDFYLGYRQLDLAQNELITHVDIPHKTPNSCLKLYKVSQRRDLDISCVSAAFMLSFNPKNQIESAAIALGGVAATALRITEVEQSLIGLTLDQIKETGHIQAVADLLAKQVSPMSDVRGSQAYRTLLVGNLYKKFINELIDNKQVTHEV